MSSKKEEGMIGWRRIRVERRGEGGESVGVEERARMEDGEVE